MLLYLTFAASFAKKSKNMSKEGMHKILRFWQYMEVEIDRDGTARLTLVPGKMETVKLTD